MTTFFIKTFGCRVNQVESQALLEQFLRSGFTPSDSFETAEICLLNTCTVTHQADKDVEKQIRQILRRNPKARLVLTGCYAAAHERPRAKNFRRRKLSANMIWGKPFLTCRISAGRCPATKDTAARLSKFKTGATASAPIALFPMRGPLSVPNR